MTEQKNDQIQKTDAKPVSGKAKTAVWTILLGLPAAALALYFMSPDEKQASKNMADRDATAQTEFGPQLQQKTENGNLNTDLDILNTYLQQSDCHKRELQDRLAGKTTGPAVCSGSISGYIDETMIKATDTREKSTNGIDEKMEYEVRAVPLAYGLDLQMGEPGDAMKAANKTFNVEDLQNLQSSRPNECVVVHSFRVASRVTQDTYKSHAYANGSTVGVACFDAGTGKLTTVPLIKKTM